MPKKIASQLDRYAEALQEMELAVPPKTLAEMQAWLVQEGINVTQSTISRFLESARSSRLQAKLLAQISSGAKQCAAVEKQFGKNPAPELETLIKLHRVLILNLTTQGNVDPELLKLADQLTRTALEYTSGKTKAAQKERELVLAEEKAQKDTCEFFLKWFSDKRAQEIATSSMSNADKIATLRKEYFKDVDALQQSGKVVLPE